MPYLSEVIKKRGGLGNKIMILLHTGKNHCNGQNLVEWTKTGGME